MVGQISHSPSVRNGQNLPPVVKVNVTRSGKLHVHGQEYHYQVKLMSGKENSLKREERVILENFFEDFFSKVDWSKGQLKKFTMIEDQGQMQVTLIQKDEISNLEESAEFKIHHASLHRLFKKKKATESEPTPLIEVAKIKESSLLRRIGDLFRGIIELIFGKATLLTRDLVYEFKGIIKHLPTHLQKDIFNQLSTVSKEERFIVNYLRTHIDMTGLDEKEIMTQILLGAYVIFDDQGETFETWSKLSSCQERMSSHESDDKQYSISGPFVKECLFSRKQMKDPVTGETRIVSWSQFERYPTKMGYYTAHLWTYVVYKLSGANQGPYGSSYYTEKSNPMILKLRPKSIQPMDVVADPAA